MKIGIITYYDVINEGAFLQAYCLKKFLENLYSDEVVFIDLEEADRKTKLYKPFLGTKNPMRLINAIRRIHVISMIQKKEFKVTNKREVDLLVVGSDELWNITNPMFSTSNFGMNIKYKHKIGYAISAGNTDISDDRLPSLKTYAQSFDKISVRDSNSLYIVKDIFKMPAVHNVDPVFLYDIPSSKPEIDYPYIMVYGGISDRKQAEAIKKFAEKKGLRIISVDIYNKWCKTVIAKTPWEFVGYIDSAAYVVTNMFHGTMLSIVRKKNFITLLTNARKKKLIYSLELFECRNRSIEADLDNLFEQMLSISDVDLNKEHIQKVIKNERKKSRAYLNLDNYYT